MATKPVVFTIKPRNTGFTGNYKPSAIATATGIATATAAGIYIYIYIYNNTVYYQT